MKQQNIILVSILIIVIVLLVRMTTENTLEFFENDSIPYGELLIKRNGENLSIYNFNINSNKLDLINGNGTTCLANGEISISCENNKRLETLYIEGLEDFKILASKNGESYDVVDTFSGFTGGFIHNITSGTGKVSGRYFRIVNTNGGKVQGVKVELYGVDEASSQKITMINGDRLTVSPVKTEKHYIVNMPANDDHLVYYVKFKTNCEYVKLFYHIQARQNERESFKLPCKEEMYNANNLNDVADGYTYIFFPHPTLASKIHIAPLRDSEGSNNNEITDLSVFGKVIANGDKPRYLEQSVYYCNPEYARNGGVINNPVIEKFSNNETKLVENFEDNSLLQSFNDTEKLCEALEYQENIKAEKLKIEKNKIYMLKLLEQEQEINSLIAMINKLKASRDKRMKDDEILKLSMYEKQKQDDAQVVDLAQNRLDNQKNLAVNLNLQPYRTNEQQ